MNVLEVEDFKTPIEPNDKIGSFGAYDIAMAQGKPKHQTDRKLKILNRASSNFLQGDLSFDSRRKSLADYIRPQDFSIT